VKGLNQNIWELKGRLAHRQKRRAQTTALHLDLKPNDIVLDLGCAEGYVTSFLAPTSFVVGIDISIDSLLIAKQKIKKANTDFIRADATRLPFKKASFNKACILEVLEHLPHRAQKKVGREVDRVLKGESTILVSVPYKEQITYTRCVHCGRLTPLWGHLSSMDQEKVASLLPNHYTLVASCHLPNIEIISLSGIFAHLPLKLWLVFNNLLGKLRKGYWILLKYQKGKIKT